MRQFLVNDKGERTAVMLPIEEYERLLEASEELEDVRRFDAAMAEIQSGEDEVIPFEQAVRDIREGRVPED